MGETTLQLALLLAAPRALPNLRLYRRNVGSARALRTGQVVQYGLEGQADLYALARGGWHGEVEVKRFTKLSPEQEHWRDWCREWGVPWACVEARRDEPPTATVDRWVAELAPWLPAP